jgi:microcystin degradation protein MlrC
MSFRLAIAGISHETNTYCRGTTGLNEFWVLRGERILRRLGGTRTEVGGMLAGCDALGATPVPVLVSGAVPSGTIAVAAYESLRDEILAGLRNSGPIDAVALALHGAGVVEGTDDLEADLAQAVRSAVGPQVPVVACFDLHGNVTQEMADVLDLGFGCHEYPHTDMYERGEEAVRHIPELLAGTLRPVSHVETVPMLLPTSTTLFGAARAMNERCWALEERPGVVDCTLFHGFPYTDTPLVGAHIYATAHDDRELARATAREAARALWDARDSFRPESLSCEQAIARALEVDGEPVVINETSDNPGGGTPGDGTHLLRAMLEAGLERACFGFVFDPQVAEAAHRAGVGATIEVELGGKSDDLHGDPLPISAYVKNLSDGRFVMQAMSRGVTMNLGKMARLVVGGIDVLVASRRNQTFDPEVFLLHGIDVERYRIVALKSSNHFRAGFQELAREIITADPPGLTTHRIEIFPRKRAPGPLWPLDDAVYA